MSKGREFRGAGTLWRRFARPLTNVPDIPNFIHIKSASTWKRYRQAAGIGLIKVLYHTLTAAIKLNHFAAVSIIARDIDAHCPFGTVFLRSSAIFLMLAAYLSRLFGEPEPDPDHVYTSDKVPYGPFGFLLNKKPNFTSMNGLSFDLAIFYADSRESEDEVVLFMELMEMLCRNSPRTPRIWASVCDLEGEDRTYLEAVEYGIKNSKYYFLYIDQSFAHDKWANFQRDQCLHMYFQETKVIVPVETIKNYTMPFSLRVFKPLKPWRLINNIDGLGMRTFLENPKIYLNVCDQHYLGIMMTVFAKICAGDPRPLFLLE